MAQTDLLVHVEGSSYLLHPTSHRGQRWVNEHISDRQELAGAIVVEHRCIADIVRGAIADGLQVR